MVFPTRHISVQPGLPGEDIEAALAALRVNQIGGNGRASQPIREQLRELIWRSLHTVGYRGCV